MAGFGLQLTIEDHSKEALEALAEALEIGLTECGIDLEGWAKDACPVGNPEKWKFIFPGNEDYVGGTLRNSIAYALDGEVPQTETGPAYEVKNPKADVPGSYETPTPKETGRGIRSVYLGTNVYYAPYVEMGTSKMDAQPFIEPAFVEHREELKQTLTDRLKGTGGSIS